jgi:hypothetical protein
MIGGGIGTIRRVLSCCLIRTTFASGRLTGTAAFAGGGDQI